MIERKWNIPNPAFAQIVGRDPIAKTVTESMIADHPDWTDQQIALGINRHYDNPVITVDEVAHWRLVAELSGGPR